MILAAVASVAPARLAYVADADTRSVIAFDPERREELARTDLAGAPSSLIVAPDGRLYAALRDRNEIAVLEHTGRPNGALVQRTTMTTESEPVALAMANGGGAPMLLVLTGWGHALEGFELATRRRVLHTVLAREPRGIAMAEDGRTAFVSHMVGGIASVVDLGAGAAGPAARTVSIDGADLAMTHDIACAIPFVEQDPLGTLLSMGATVRETRRFGLQGFALARVGDRVLAPQVLVRTGDPRARTGGYGETISDLPSHVPAVAVLDAATGAPTYASLHVGADAVAGALRVRRSCVLPRAAAADPRAAPCSSPARASTPCSSSTRVPTTRCAPRSAAGSSPRARPASRSTAPAARRSSGRSTTGPSACSRSSRPAPP